MGCSGGVLSAMDSLTEKLINLKQVVRQWERHKKRAHKLELLAIEEDTATLFSSCSGGFLLGRKWNN